MKIAPWILIALAFLTTACASLGPAYQPVSSVPADKALVYIYRPSSFIGGGISYTVHAGDRPVVKLYNGGYTAFLATPGETEFWARTEARASITESLQPGKTYFIRGKVGVGLVAGRPKLEWVPANVGQSEIASCKLIPENDG